MDLIREYRGECNYRAAQSIENRHMNCLFPNSDESNVVSQAYLDYDKQQAKAVYDIQCRIVHEDGFKTRLRGDLKQNNVTDKIIEKAIDYIYKKSRGSKTFLDSYRTAENYMACFSYIDKPGFDFLRS